MLTAERHRRTSNAPASWFASTAAPPSTPTRSPDGRASRCSSPAAGAGRRSRLLESSSPRVFSNIRADVAFLGSGGLDADAGLTDFHIDECATRKTILAGTAKSYVLADATRFGHVAPQRVCGFDRAEAVITDQCPPDRIRDAIESAGASALF